MNRVLIFLPTAKRFAVFAVLLVMGRIAQYAAESADPDVFGNLVNDLDVMMSVLDIYSASFFYVPAALIVLLAPLGLVRKGAIVVPFGSRTRFACELVFGVVLIAVFVAVAMYVTGVAYCVAVRGKGFLPFAVVNLLCPAILQVFFFGICSLLAVCCYLLTANMALSIAAPVLYGVLDFAILSTPYFAEAALGVGWTLTQCDFYCVAGNCYISLIVLAAMLVMLTYCTIALLRRFDFLSANSGRLS